MNGPILYLVGQLGAGGLERQLFLILRALDRKHCPAHVAVWNLRDEDQNVERIRALGVAVHSLGTGSRLARFQRLRAIVRDTGARLIHSYSFYTNAIAQACAATVPGLCAVGSVRSSYVFDRREVGVVLGRLCARWPRTQIYNSEAAIAHARAHGGVWTPRATGLVRNCADLQAYRPHLRGTETPPLIVAIGSLLPVKRWDRLVAAAVRLRAQGLDFHVALAGEGPLGRDLADAIARAGLADRFRLEGRVDDIPAWLGRASFAVHVSDIEGCPNAVVEAMSSGLPVVATRVGDVPALVAEGECGFLVAPDDADALVDRMARLIQSPELRRRFGAAARERAEREFDPVRAVREHLAMYRLAGWEAPPACVE